MHVAQGPVQAARLIIKEEGILGLWAGAAPTVMRNGTNQMCLFWAKNNFDSLFFGKHEGDGRTLHPWQSMVSGFSAACLGPVATGPFDVIKVLGLLHVPLLCMLSQKTRSLAQVPARACARDALWHGCSAGQGPPQCCPGTAGSCTHAGAALSCG